MAATVSTGWRAVTPGVCFECGSDDEWECDGRGAVLCSCQACPDCGLVSAEGFHEPGCPTLLADEDADGDADGGVDGDAGWASVQNT